MCFYRSIFLLVLVLLFSGLSTEESLEQYLDNQMHRAMKKLHLPALAITIVQDQNTVYKKATGYADLERGMRVNSQSIFKVWSVSKVFTAIEIFREVEEGLIHVWQMFPDVPEASDAVQRIGAFISRHC